MSLGNEIKEIAKKNIDIPGLVKDLLKEVAGPALDAAVLKTSTPLDDVAKAALFPVLEKELNEKVAELWAKI